MARTKQTAGKRTCGKAPRAGLTTKAARVPARKGPRSAVYRPGNRALPEIRKYQRSTELVMKKTPFTKCVKKVLKF